MARRLALLTLALALSGPAAAQGCAHALTVGLDQFAPYAFRAAGGQWRGIDVEMAQAILREAGCQLALGEPMPAMRYMTLFKEGDVALVLGASDTAERRQYAWFSKAYRQELVGLFVLGPDAGRYRTLTAFDAIGKDGLTLLAPRAGWYGEQYAQHRQRLRERGALFEFTNFEQGLRMLAAHRATFIMGDASAIRHEARRQQMQVTALPWTVLRAPVHLMFSKAGQDLVDLGQVDAAIDRLDRSGVLKAILHAYEAP